VEHFQLAELEVHNWAVAEDMVAVAGERRRCIVAGRAVAAEVRHRRPSRGLLENTMMRCRGGWDFVDLLGNRRRR
jgi:hypothetical protein